jgi:hypothetical protein
MAAPHNSTTVLVSTTLLDRTARQWRAFRHGSPIIVVSGLPRSGTSAVMQMLQAGGVQPFADGIRTPDEDNPRGYFEHERVKTLATDPDPSWLRSARGRAIKVISSLLEHLPPDNNYAVLFLQRDLGDIAASQNRMLARRGMPVDPDTRGIVRTFEAHLRRVHRLLEGSRVFRTIEIPYEGLVADPALEARRIRTFLGRNLDVERMAAVVDPRLFRNRRGARGARVPERPEGTRFASGPPGIHGPA